MKAVIYVSLSRKKRSKEIALTINGDHFELQPGGYIPRFYIGQLFVFGYATIKDKRLPYAIPKIDFSKYDEVVLVFPIWTGRMSQFMRSYLKSVPFTNKKVTLVATSNSGTISDKHNIKENVDDSNEVIDVVIYKGTQLTI